jgi:hypothetical protein
MRQNKSRQLFRQVSLEQCEDRQMMAADLNVSDLGTPDFYLDPAYLQSLADIAISQQGTLDNPLYQNAATAHDLTGFTNALNNYGLTGSGQTVVVIDSGIAYDHLALGGGYGSNYRVVGGWDFAENDANPYDDGPAGSHGTHVAGIIGGTTSNAQGVASGVDLVSLRVFNDQGSGYFSWVENALKWVHNNRNAFENPITTVNLSIGAGWNASTLPNWAMLEDELAVLKADGIFVSVAAGNAFGSVNTPGLDYPAVSPYVVPVMSVNNDGTLSNFSQRLQTAIAAPGGSIRSAVPDYMGNMNGRADDYANFSGTSMASPYIAGASVLIREAMQLAGRTNITQDTIYNHMMQTADTVYDSATGLNYKRLNLQRALDTLMPADEYGNNTTTAATWTNAASGAAFNGMLNSRQDADFFRFVASATGTITINSTTRGEAALNWQINSASGTTTATGNSVTMNVVAGQTYTIGLTTTAGIGTYSLTMSGAVGGGNSNGGSSNSGGSNSGSTGGGSNSGGGSSSGGSNSGNTGSNSGSSNSGNVFAPSGSTTNVGVVRSTTQAGITLAGDAWYRATASQAGTFTAEALLGTSSSVTLSIYNTSGTLLATQTLSSSSRLDLQVTSGQELVIKLTGNTTGVSLRLTNLVSLSGTLLNVYGTTGDDTVSVARDANWSIVVNGVSYSYTHGQASIVTVFGSSGNDAVTITGTAAKETAYMRVGLTSLIGSGYCINAVDFENTTVNGNGGADVLEVYDSAGNDTLNVNLTSTSLTGTGFQNIANGFKIVTAFATAGGYDTANVTDTAGNDLFYTGLQVFTVLGSGYTVNGVGFEATTITSIGGNDVANMRDSAGNDIFTATPTSASMQIGNTITTINGCETVLAVGTTGFDQAYIGDSTGNDGFYYSSSLAYGYGTNFNNAVQNFDKVTLDATRGGNDWIDFFDAYGNDTFEADGNTGRLTSAGLEAIAIGFESVRLNGSYGTNTVVRRSATNYLFSIAGSWR